MIHELISRLEAANAADRELDAEISLATRPPDFPASVYAEMVKSIPHYTASIDAAVALVSAGTDAWRRLTHQSMSVYSANPYNAAAQKRFDGTGATPAIQLCAAALRARFAKEIEAELLAQRALPTKPTPDACARGEGPAVDYEMPVEPANDDPPEWSLRKRVLVLVCGVLVTWGCIAAAFSLVWIVGRGAAHAVGWL